MPAGNLPFFVYVIRAALAKNPPVWRCARVTPSRANTGNKSRHRRRPGAASCCGPALSGTGHEHVRKGTKVFEALAYALGQFANLGAGEWSGRHGDSLAHRPVSRSASSASRAAIPLS
jgi:hypothetical protein